MLAIGLSLLAGSIEPICAQEHRPPREYEIKAAFLYHFARFVDWPPDKSKGDLVVCVRGGNPFGTALTKLEAKSAGTRTLTTRQVTGESEISACHILFLSSTAETPIPQLLAGVPSEGVLTVGETDTFVDDGGMIRLFAADNNIRFEINREAARRAGLTISSRMLRLANNG